MARRDIGQGQGLLSGANDLAGLMWMARFEELLSVFLGDDDSMECVTALMR